jgi:hypothetical protein
MAKKTGFSTSWIDRINNKLKIKATQEEPNFIRSTGSHIWVIFNFRSPLIRKITNIFKNTNLPNAFRSSSTLNSLLGKLTNTNRAESMNSNATAFPPQAETLFLPYLATHCSRVTQTSHVTRPAQAPQTTQV